MGENALNRKLGDTEHNWVRAVKSGTGITVAGLVFSHPFNLSELQHALDLAQTKHPRLRSELVWQNGQPAFQVRPHAFVKIEQIEHKHDSNSEEEVENPDWILVVEQELNINIWKDLNKDSPPSQLLVARIYSLPRGRSLFVFRVHAAICDVTSLGIIFSDLLHTLVGIKKGEILLSKNIEIECPMESPQLLALENLIPKSMLKKSFWAHGIDLVGYTVGALRHALLPFEVTGLPMHSRVIQITLDVQQTQNLLQTCEKENTTLFGAMYAAGLKITASCKELGKRSESFAVVGLIDCRKALDQISDATIGFYYSAILNTQSTNEHTEFWDLARKCSKSFQNAIDNRKHFTDMGSLNYLMFQALQHPSLTPSSSLRTSLLGLYNDPIKNGIEDFAEVLGVEAQIGCSSIHGVGPALTIFHTIHKGALRFDSLYVAPLYSPRKMHELVHKMTDMLVSYSSS